MIKNTRKNNINHSGPTQLLRLQQNKENKTTTENRPSRERINQIRRKSDWWIVISVVLKLGWCRWYYSACECSTGSQTTVTTRIIFSPGTAPPGLIVWDTLIYRFIFAERQKIFSFTHLLVVRVANLVMLTVIFCSFSFSMRLYFSSIKSKAKLYRPL